MKKITAISLIFAILGMAILAGSLLFCLTSLDRNAIMVATPKAAEVCSENLMSAIQAGDFTTATDYLYGQVNLGADRDPGDDLGTLIWDAFQDSITYEFVGDCYATTTGVARDLWITTLDPTSLNRNLSQRVTDLAEGSEEGIYDQEGNLREDLFHQILLTALEESLDQDASTISHKIQLNLVYQNGQWLVVPDAALLQAISGGVAG